MPCWQIDDTNAGVAGRRCRERFGAELASGRGVDHGGDVNVVVGVDPRDATV
jgi:hypothetical protein